MEEHAQNEAIPGQNDPEANSLNKDDDLNSSDGDDSESEDNGLDDNEKEENTSGSKPASQSKNIGKKSKSSTGKKRRKASNKRRNIRKVLRLDQLDPKTLEAQKEEQERLRRLELQRSILNQMATSSNQNQDANSSNDADIHNPNNEDYELDMESKPIFVIDDDNDDYNEPSNSSGNYQDQSSLLIGEEVTENVILISSSESEGDDEIDDEDEIDSSDECQDLTSTTNFRNDNGEILVNVGHAHDEPDIFLPPQITRTIKPHQILGIRFLFDNLIESVKDFKTNHGVGCILAHAMGLGKTIQTISLVHIFLKFTKARKVLVLVPVNTLQNWLNEFNMWVPELPGNQMIDKNSTITNGDSSSIDAEAINNILFNNGSSPKEDSTCGEDDCNKGLDTDACNCDGQTEVTHNKDDNNENCKDVNEKAASSKSSESCKSKDEEVEHREYKVYLLNDAQKTTVARAKVIGQWNEFGGVLIMGYEMFRMLAMYTASLCNSVTNAKGKKKKQAKKSSAVIDIEEEEKEMQLFLSMQSALCKPGPDLVVCDEGHRIKNHQSNIHQALHKIQTRKRLVLTGYPLQNNLTEYWCMVDFVRPNYLGSRQEFQNMFERPIVNGQCIDSTAEDKKLMKYRAHVLSSLLKGFIQRTDYSALKVALPDKQEHVIMIRLSTVQQAVYRRFLEWMQEGYGDQLNPIKIFAVCSKIWNHPDILFKAMKADQSKKGVLFETDEDNVTEDGAKIQKINSRLNLKEARSSPALGNDESRSSPLPNGPRTPLTSITDWAKEIFDSHQYREGLVDMSGKLIVFLEILNESVARGDKVLVFSQSLMTLDLIEEFLGCIPIVDYDVSAESTNGSENRFWKKNTDYFRIDGSTSSSERERLIDLFNKPDNTATKLFLLSTRAGCLGINLVAANRVIVFDVSWNPCHDAQAVCRVYRYGQRKPCYIYRLIASNTMEKRMYYRQISKQGVSDRVIDELNPIENFTKDELHKLLSTSWDDEPQKDFTEDCKSMCDPVLKRLCQTCSPWIVSAPFKHESLLQDEKTSKLSTREKREAKRGYEEEKRKSTFGNNGPLSFRFPAFMPRGPMQMPTLMARPGLHNFGALSNSSPVMRPMVANSQYSSLNIPEYVALANILRRAEFLRRHGINSASLGSLTDAGRFSQSSSSMTLSGPVAPSTLNNANLSQDRNGALITPSGIPPSLVMHGSQNSLFSTETMSVGPSISGGIRTTLEGSDRPIFEGELPTDETSSEFDESVEVICIDSDDDDN